MTIYGNETGCYLLYLNLTGPNSSVYYAATSPYYINVVANTTLLPGEPVTPQLSSVTLDPSTGAYILLTFDSATNRETGTGSSSATFPCSNLLSFTGRSSVWNTTPRSATVWNPFGV